MEYEDYLSIDHSKYDLCETTKPTKTKKFSCEAPIGFGKSTAIRKWISAHKIDRFTIITPTVNMVEEFYVKLCKTNKVLTFDYALMIIHLLIFIKLYMMKLM